ncbi:cell division-specific peptidoglycan biosynthesis regulator FtsW [Gracilibacillus ureilyticus]|uniref:Probable peptidoglycan glycosyltransferase FtsW n=1 Tax=Gracilibacillus ureilyticus TaxID=531814 RepID=A0A1H9TIL0_9BACI|nr:FtsW/RodA/SpoVE family cell cycle protein [Gracilibacillus ureilyticus]SER97180.1 cell division-specific peptidoglycan biosynthesis regulator FtsW [Gracilibacillus ureilyticus]
MKLNRKTFDFLLMLPPLLLSSFGIVMIYSASMVTTYIADKPAYSMMLKQSVWFAIAIFAFLFACFFNYKIYQRMTKVIIGILTILLVAVMLFGTEINYSKSWLYIGPFSVQPSEFVKIGLVMYLASVYTNKQEYIDDFFKAVLPPLVITSLLLGLIIQQPDIGTAGIIFSIACVVIFSSGIKFRHLSLLIGVGAVLLVALGLQMMTDEKISRFTGAYQPFADPEHSGYQLIQSYIAIATGGISGTGIGQGIQKLGYLTQAESDFIMAVIAEELGLFGVLFVIVCIAIIVLRGFFIAMKCENKFGSLLAIGISAMFGIQTIINLGAISGLLPITGVPLPFVSYGGTSLLVSLFSVGVLNNIARHVNYNRYQERIIETEQENKPDSYTSERRAKKSNSYSSIKKSNALK